MRTLSALLCVVLASAFSVLAAAAPAAAHGTLAMSTPADGATVTGPLTAVELYFTEKVAANAYFTITALGGKRVDNGWTHGAPKPLAKPVREYFLVEGKLEPREYTTGFPAVVAVAHLPAAGQYSVSYLSVASDGETVRGTMTFRYNGRATAAPSGSTKAITPRAGGLSNARLALLVGGLVVALLAGFGLGRLGSGGGAIAGASAATAGGPVAAHTHSGDGGTQATGTTVSAGGYPIQPVQRSQPAGATVDYRFRIAGTDQRAATRFAVVHEKPLHMIVVGRDLGAYQHLHPAMAPTAPGASPSSWRGPAATASTPTSP
ncbi:copper resistance CopC family protein [Phytohabitans rumicis]|uniref:CopC domain-containing protein n=1 Tax=Phytohabitans rumicis TaxID=1076125 RepID=A0A6V8KTH8_9ACTN|nr:copper resistance protein CopC [Phytohabitans rumicis]GFJ86730.1 hypothetical protein Prum_003720 [Phytohabitans rumicis]